MATNYTTSFNINIDDLQFILKQIRIAEASSIGYGNAAPVSILQAIMDAYGATAEAAALLPAGLRTVDGTFNNLLIAPTVTDPGTSEFGAADTLFPRLTDPVFISDASGTIDFDGAGPGPAITQGNYGVLADASPAPGLQPGIGSVVDTAPRIISNLIVDMSINNPAAIAAYLSNPLSLEQFETDHPGMNPVAPGEVVNSNDLEITNTDLQTMPNLSPDIGLSPGFNSWMTFFGQFFDHGLDLVTKGTNGTVYIPLQPDDPLYVVGSNTNFMALTRATVTLDANGVPQHENTTTSWIDQNQTYTSHASHQVFLREYVMTANGAVSTGRLLDGTAASGSSAGAIGNWGEVKAQALTMLGITLTDFDVHNVPLLMTDQYGKFIPGANGFAQVATTTGFVEGTATGLDLTLIPNLVRTNHAFLNDIAHHATPGRWDSNGDGRVTSADALQVADSDTDQTTDDGLANTYDDEMLNSHFITGDGRGNENIALTAVHSIFHSEHNRAVEVNKATLLENAANATLNSADHTNAVAFLNEWLVDDVAANLTAAQIEALNPADLTWDGERLFQAARFSTEMQYQHMVFEEFARRIQPFVDPFIFTNTAEIDPSIVAEFAHTVYRFGHSMLTGTVDRLDNSLVNPITGDATQDTLLAVFLNPQAYTAGGVDSATINADLIRGLSRDVGNAMDEFIVTDVRSNLLGLPLDLAALNIARGRDTGIPSLNETRAQLYEATNLADLKPYENWADFAANIKNPMSIINFIAAYGTHASIVAETTVDGMREAAMKLVFGDDTLTGQAAIDFENDRFDFLGATGIYATPALGGMNNIDLWIGGLAEANPEFGGMLGTTFNYVFEYQMESLQNGDRMYYLSRTQGLNFLNQLEPNTFADMVMRNTELGDIYSTHLNGLLFVTPDHFFELDRGIAQEDYDAGAGIDPLWAAGETHSLLTPLKVTRNYTNATTTVDPETGITHDVGGTFKFFGGEHVVVGGTEGNDKIWTDKGIDTLWGDGGNDYLNAGTESDQVFGGEGDDIIEDPFGDDFLRGGLGNDVVSSARGFDVMFGEQGQDYIILGQDASEVFAGQDNDFILGGAGTDALLGNEGDDWIEGGDGLDGLAGENSQLFFDSTIIGHDVLNGQGNDTDYDGESGDDIMVQGAGIQRSNGMFGFDWGIHKNDLVAADSDLGIPIFAAQTAFTLRDRFDSVEGLSGWSKDDILTGAAVLKGGAAGFGVGPGNPVDESDLKAKNVHLIDGFADLLGLSPAQLAALVAQELAEEAVAPVSPTAARSSSIISIVGGAEIIIGGGGSDTIKGNLGNDILDGDAWLNVRIKIVQGGITYSAESMSTDTLVMGQYAGKVFNTNLDGSSNFASPAFGGATLSSLMLNGTINPGNLSIVREILQSTTAASDVDTAVYNGAASEYTVVLNSDGSRTVTHTPPAPVNGGGVTLDDGVDTIRNFERLQFADQTVRIAGTNAVATGDVSISDTAPFEDSVLLASGVNFLDDNGINASTLTYTWEAEIHPGQWVEVGTGTLFTPGDAEVGLALRVRANFIDMVGVTETILSEVTAGVQNVNDVPVGLPVISGVAGEDQTLTVSTAGISDIDGLGTFSYQWTRNGVAFGGTTNPTLILGDADVGAVIAVDVSYTDLNGTFEVLTSASTLPVVNVNDAPTGIVSIDDITPDLNQILLASNTLADLDGLGPINYQWQSLNTSSSLWENIGTNSASFLTTNAEVGRQLHVVASYTDGAGSVEVVTSSGTATVGAFNIINGTINSETINGTVLRDRINGNGGNDVLNGLNSDDELFGAEGNDILNGGTGADTLTGGIGNDTYVVDNAGDVVIEAAASGTDRVNSSITYDLGAGSNVEYLTLTGSAAIDGTGNELNNLIIGNSASNTLSGGNGSDTLDGGAGADTLTGGAGADSYVVDNAGDVVVEAAGGGTDRVNSSITYDLGVGSNVENLTLTGAASINGTGNELNNTIVGNGADNTLNAGTAGMDTLVGGAGNDIYIVDHAGVTVTEVANGGTDTVQSSVTTTITDVDVENLTLTGATNINGTGNTSDNVIAGNTGNNALSGGAGTDTISGGAGTDTISGGAGQDTLTGGTGKDRFAYTATADTGTDAATRDVITDFATVNAATLANSDLINVNVIDANTGAGGNQNFAFIGVAAFSAAGQIRYVQIGADTFIEGNVDAGLAADFSIQLSGLHVFGQQDFLL